MPHAKSFATGPGASLIVVHVEEKTLLGKGGSSLPCYATQAELKEKVQRQVAERESADVIVVGSRGHTPLAGLLLGNVPQRLLHLARCPVLTVPVSNSA